MGENRYCPECNTLMEFRLGIYECPGCGRQAEKEIEQPQPASGPGFRREPWQHPSLPVKAEASGPSLYGTAEEDKPAAPRPLKGLELEKRIFFWIAAVMTGLGIMASLRNLITGNHGIVYILSDVFWDAAYLFVLAFVLFAGEAWAKGCCAILVILNLLALVGATFILVPYLSSMAGVSGILPAFISWPFWLSILVNGGWSAWLLLILWRDNQIYNPV